MLLQIRSHDVAEQPCTELAEISNLLIPFQIRTADWQHRVAALQALKAKSLAECQVQAAEAAPLVVALRIEFEAAMDEVGRDYASNSEVCELRTAMFALREDVDELF
jgi:hypothetical protein